MHRAYMCKSLMLFEEDILEFGADNGFLGSNSNMGFKEVSLYLALLYKMHYARLTL